MKSHFIVLLLLLLPLAGFGAAGSIIGTVHDEKTGDELVGANILIVGTTQGASTDLEGKYIIKPVAPGEYTLRVSYIGYAAKVITGVTIHDGETLKLDLILAEESFQSEEVTVTAERVLSTDAAILAERKKAAAIGDGLSAEQVKRTPDATSGDALKRVTGISVVDNKFVFIRGVTDRYNGTTLNGVTTTSTEVGKKSFTFDLLPANLLENTVVVKSATPDMAGDFTGGMVQLNTLDFPDRQVVKLSLATGYNSMTTSQSMFASQGGGNDWLAFGMGSREFPENLTNQYDVARSLPNTWAPRAQRAPYNGSFTLSFGDRYDIGESDQLGLVSALSYKNSFQRAEVTTDYVSEGGDPLSFQGTNDQYSVLWGGLLDMSYKFGDGLHKISLKNSYNRSADDRVNVASGYDANGDVNRTTIEWSEKSVYAGSLTGQHRLQGLASADVQWRLYASSSIRNEPDRRSLEYARSAPNPFSARPGERSWSNFNERLKGVSADVSIPLGENKVKLGALVEGRNRGYNIKYFQIDANNVLFPQNFYLFQLPIDSIYLPENFGPGKYGMNLVSNTSDQYLADQTLYAGYFMLDLPFSFLEQHFRFVGGARLENSDQNVLTTDAPGSSKLINSQLKRVDILPSMNLTYLVNDITNVRLAYSHSVNRPEFREMSSVYIYDFDTYEALQGNPRLQRAYIRNYDVRVEVFPHIGDVLAVSYFYKSITSAIEERLISSSKPLRTWFNSDRGRNFGWELEIRKSLEFLGGYFRNFSITGNYTRIQSKIEYTEKLTDPNNQSNIIGEVVHTRPMQGQSPYMINLSLLFTEPTLGTTVSLLYNKFGSRIDAVGYNDADTYEQPRDVIDIAVTQPLLSMLDAKFTVKDLNGKDQVFTRGEHLYRRYSRGTTYSLSLSMNL